MSGLPYAKLSLAVNRQTTGADGAVQKTVSCIDVIVERHQAEICVATLRRGSVCMAVGTLQQDRWTDKDGTSRSLLKVKADRIQFLDRRIESSIAASDASASEERRS